MTQLVDNERTKLLANALDRASTAVFTVGIVTPMVSYLFDLNNVRLTLGGGWGLIGFMAVFFIGAAALHMAARYALGLLRP